MSSNFPIVFLYRGNRDFIPYTLYQAKQTNPNTRIILLGDESNKHYKIIAEHFYCDDFLNGTEQLKKVYRHKSQWGQDFEYVCIERWFILLNFMEKTGLESAILLDSDILVYSDLNQVRKTFPSYNMTWMGFSAHINFVQSRQTLKDYCDFILDIYTNHDKYLNDETLSYAQVMSGRSEGNVSDMTFFYDFNKKHPNNFHNLAIPQNNKMFDITIEMDQGMEMEGKFKKIEWKGKTPYAVSKIDGNLIQLYTIHFWTKDAIKNFFTCNSPSFVALNLYFKFIYLLQRIRRNIKKILSRQKQNN